MKLYTGKKLKDLVFHLVKTTNMTKEEIFNKCQTQGYVHLTEFHFYYAEASNENSK